MKLLNWIKNLFTRNDNSRELNTPKLPESKQNTSETPRSSNSSTTSFDMLMYQGIPQ